MSAKTDSQVGISYDPENRPEISNLLNIYSSLSNIGVEELCKEFESSNTGNFKNKLVDIVIDHLNPIQNRMDILRKEQQYIHQVSLFSQGMNCSFS